MEQRHGQGWIGSLFFGFAVLGTDLPLATVAPWIAAHGLDAQRFVQDLFASRVSAFFAWDVVVSAVAVVVAALTWPGLARRQRLAVVGGTLLVGVSCGLPLLLAWLARRDQVR